jgi:hypothetical protein
MPDEKPKPNTPPAPAPDAPVTPELTVKEKKEYDETVPGGRYKIGDQLVDADGNPIKNDD